MRIRHLLFLILPVAMMLAGFDRPKVKHAPPPNTDPSSGAEMYKTYCAVCHGLDGRGHGPAAPALTAEIPDLTQLAKQNHGEFPVFRVAAAIQGDSVITAHGTKDMPIWGDVFRELKRDEAVVKLRVHNLTQYIASLQEK